MTRRIGVSIAIPEPWGSQLQDCRQGFGDPMARSVPTHVTLVPPTEVAEDGIAGVEAHLHDVAERSSPFVMALHGTGSFRPVSPVVFVQVAVGISSCEVLQRALRTGPLGRPLPFPYHPHVTVAHDLPGPVLDRASTELADYRARFDVTAFHLYEHGTDGVWRPRRSYLFSGEPLSAATG